MEQYLIVGGVLFWIFAAIATVLLFAAVANDSIGGALVVSIAAALILAFAFDVALLKYAPQTWWGWVLAIAGYFGVGACWSFFKFAVVYKDDLRDAREQWKSYNTTGGTPWDEWLEKGHGPQAWEYSNRIAAWIAYWPISVAIYLLADFVRHVAEQVYEWFSGIYEGIAKRLRESMK